MLNNIKRSAVASKCRYSRELYNDLLGGIVWVIGKQFFKRRLALSNYNRPFKLMRGLFLGVIVFFVCVSVWSESPAEIVLLSDIEVTGNVGFVSEYSLRGIAQSDEDPAIQGAVDFTHKSGSYFGIWGSSVDFNDNDEAHFEYNLYGGYASEINNINYNIGAIYYGYPGADSSLDYDFNEVYLSLNYDFDAFSATTSVNYSPDIFGGSGEAMYYTFSVDVPLPNNFSLSHHVGHQIVDDEAAFGVPDYTDWLMALNYSLGEFDFSLKYIDTDLDEPRDCASGCESRVIFSAFRGF